jgi:hypothetical protein
VAESWWDTFDLYHEITIHFQVRSWRGVLDTTLCDKVCQWLATGRWFYLGTAVSSINKIDRYNITEILLKVALSTINQTKPFSIMFIFKQKYQTYEYQHNGGWHQQKRVFRKISTEYRNLKTFLFPKVIFPGF